MQGSG